MKVPVSVSEWKSYVNIESRHSYDITRLDTGENVVRGKDVGMRYESTGRSSEPGFSYAPTDRKARNMASYFDYDGIIEKERSRDKISEKWAIYKSAAR